MPPPAMPRSLALHAGATRLGADQQRPVGVLKHLVGVDAQLDLTQQRVQAARGAGRWGSGTQESQQVGQGWGNKPCTWGRAEALVPWARAFEQRQAGKQVLCTQGAFRASGGVPALQPG